MRIKLRVGGAPEPFNCFKIFDMLKVGEEETPPTGQSFSVWVLPGRPRCYGSVTNPHRSKSAPEGLPVGTIIPPVMTATA